MFKRFEVTDLFHGDNLNEKGEWIDVDKDMPSQTSGIYKVKLKSNEEIWAYYYEDKIIGLMGYYKDKPSHWWSKDDKMPLYNVTHWKDRDLTAKS